MYVVIHTNVHKCKQHSTRKHAPHQLLVGLVGWLVGCCCCAQTTITRIQGLFFSLSFYFHVSL